MAPRPGYGIPLGDDEEEEQRRQAKRKTEMEMAFKERRNMATNRECEAEQDLDIREKQIQDREIMARKLKFGEMIFGDMIFGEMTISKLIVGEMIFGEIYRTPLLDEESELFTKKSWMYVNF
ncbi:hypothetical protein RhiirB3_394821 [Rhizophagus irregularis]|nr:hypothetical protein RhiirB3_394821 [Rhizophagus irregularis]